MIEISLIGKDTLMRKHLELNMDPNGHKIYKALLMDKGISLDYGKLYVRVPADTAIDLGISQGLREFHAYGKRIELDVEILSSYYMVKFECEGAPEVKPWGVDLFEDVYQVRPTS